MKASMNNRLTAIYLFIFVFLASVFTVNFLGSEAGAATQRSKACLRQSTAGASIAASNSQATARFKIPKECGRQTVSFVSYTAPNGTNGRPYSQQRVHASVTKSLNPGQHTMSVAIPDCFYQVDLVRGGVKRSFADGSTYHGEGRFLKARHGGSKSCTTKPAAKPKPQPQPQQPAPAPASVVKNAVCESLTGRQTSARGSLPATFMFTTRVTNPNGNISSYAYDFGDGNTTQSTSNRVTHTYNQAGTYQVSVRINSTGNTGDNSPSSNVESTSTTTSRSSANNSTGDTEMQSSANNSANGNSGTTNYNSGTPTTSSNSSNNSGNDTEDSSSGTVMGDNRVCRTTITITENRPVQPDTTPQTPAASQPVAEERTQPAPKPADELPDTGAGTLAAFGFGSSFMSALALAYRGRLSSLVASIINRF